MISRIQKWFIFFFMWLILIVSLTDCKSLKHTPIEKAKSKTEWVSIPAGTFTMGSPENEFSGEIEKLDEETQHQVTLSAFKMSKHEVTFEQYDFFCEATKRKRPDDCGWGRGSRPVINVSWNDAKAFASWVGCRLPTEAEWEYACRAGTTSPFNTGNNLTTSQANYNGDFPYNNSEKGKNIGETVPIGSYYPNDFGLFDMHGNVYEWCMDWAGEYPTYHQTNPKGAQNGTYRIVRGGSWINKATSCRSAHRNKRKPDFINRYYGFRLVADL